MKTQNTCKTVTIIIEYGDKRLKRLVSRGKVRYSHVTYKIANKLPSIDEAIYYEECTGQDPQHLRNLRKLYKSTCKELYKAIKKATKEAK